MTFFIFPISSVSWLLFRIGPTAIFGWIALHVVDSINASFVFWPSAHVFQEVFVWKPPSLANFYSSTSVVWKFGVFWIVTSSNYRFPCYVLSRKRIAVSMQMSTNQTSATYNVTRSYPWCTNDFQCSALAFEQSKPMRFFKSMFPFDRFHFSRTNSPLKYLIIKS